MDYKAEALRMLHEFWRQLRSHELRERGYAWSEIGEALCRQPSTIKSYYRHAERELVYRDTIHYFLSEKTRRLLHRLEVDTQAHSGAEQAHLFARSYFDKGNVRGIGPATAVEILNAIEDLNDSRKYRPEPIGERVHRATSA